MATAKKKAQNIFLREHLPPDFDPSTPSRESILAVLRNATDALSLSQLAEQLGTQFPLSVGTMRRINAMQRDGQLNIDAQQRITVNTKTKFISGRVQGHRDGFGFLIRDDGGPDLYLSPREMLRVLHGDRVLARGDHYYKGRPEGIIVEVLESQTNRLVGRFVKEGGICSVIPEDKRIKHDIFVVPQDSGGAKNGQVVVVEITRQPSEHMQPMGRVIEVLGAIDDPGMEIEIAVRKFDVPAEFSADALKQAQSLPREVRPQDFKGRVDLREVPFITIDGEDARDFDDAIYIQEVDIGRGKRYRPGWRLLVAISDVSHYVKPKDPIDTDALARGTSVYFPRRVIPMLPEELSNGICSLNPHVDRLVLVCDMVIPADGARKGVVTAYQFYPAVIRSWARTTYTQVWEALQQPEGPAAKQLGDVLPVVETAYELYQALSEQRRERGGIEFDTVETQIIYNELGRIERIEPLVRNDAHRLIEEFMLAANTSAADFIARNKRKALYRVHEGPTPEKLEALRSFLKTLGLHLGGGEEPTYHDYARLIQVARSREDFEIIQTMILRSMQQAIYSPENSGHFGLAYERYMHFTAPIRRYPDLLTHRMIHAILKSKRYVPHIDLDFDTTELTKKEYEQAVWEQLGAVLSARERRADDASYDVLAWLKCYFAQEHIGEVFSGRITGVTQFGIFVTLESLYIEGLVHISELGTDYFIFNEATHELVGERTGIRYRLTDQVHVQIANVSLEERQIDFHLVEGAGVSPNRPDAPVASRAMRKAATAKPASAPSRRQGRKRKTPRISKRSGKRN